MKQLSKFLIIKTIGRIFVPSRRIREGLHRVLAYLKRPYHAHLIRLAEKNHAKAIVALKRKKPLRVAFFVVHASVWKFDDMYRMMEADSNFDPIVVVCPYIIFGPKIMHDHLSIAMRMFNEKGYRTICTLSEDDSWIDIKSEVNPDLVIFTNPHNQTRKEYHIANYTDRLTGYIPYGFMLPRLPQVQFNQLFHNLTWRCFYETPIHKEMAQKYARNHGRNVVVTGYPACDPFITSKLYNNPWPSDNKERKRIIWAPHHTIEENKKIRGFSTFLMYHDFMFEVLDKFPSIDIAFKPHPGLKAKLYQHKEWGVERTDAYFQRWAEHPNGMVCEGEYYGLFMGSDALILDSISFIAEYIYTGKPSLFLVRDDSVLKKFNEFGDLALDAIYKSYTPSSTFNFIDSVVLKGNDKDKSKRERFIKVSLLPPNGRTASENILAHLNQQLQLSSQ